jgi:hypothetical protein
LLALRPWFRQEAFSLLATTSLRPGDDRIEELVQSATLAAIEATPAWLQKSYVRASHLKADVRQTAVKAMSASLDFARPNGVGVTRAARYSRKRRGTPIYRDTDPVGVKSFVRDEDEVVEDVDPREAFDPRYPTEPPVELARRDRAEFLAWFRAEWDRQGTWLERAVAVLITFPQFQHEASKMPNVDKIAKWLELPSGKALKRRLIRLAGRVAASCDVPEFAEIGEEIWGSQWIRVAKIGKRQKEVDRGTKAA